MKVHTDRDTARIVGEFISKLIADTSGDTMCLLSGGSALNVIEHIKVRPLPECRTIFMMGDERVSGEIEVNNFLQLNSMYPDHPVTKMTLDSSADQDETVEDFSTRIKNIFEEKFSELYKPTVIVLLGIGTDGHTAGIFPLPEKQFTEVYEADPTYVPVHLKDLTIDSRASFTPSWILNNATHVIGYAVGESKKLILKSLINEFKEIHERPAELLKRHPNSVLFTDCIL